MTFSEIVEDHGWDTRELVLLKYKAVKYRLFNTGFVMLIPKDDKGYVMISAAVDDIYPREMWRYIRSILLTRELPIVIQYVRNYDKLFKASQRYGAIALDNNIVYFP
jgi:hypothetical protein